MKKTLVIVNADTVFPDGVRRACVKAENGKISDIRISEDNLPLFPECVRGEDGKIHGASEIVEVIDAEGAYLLPGFVDTHVHGGGGFDFCDLTAEAFSEVVRVHAENGTTSICPTAVSSGLDILDRMFDVYHSLQKESFPSTLIGLHLEGPFLSPKQSGAQNKSRLAPPTKENVDRLAKSGGDIISRIGVAPELDGAFYAGDVFSDMGALVSIAHSDALYETAAEAVCHGFRHITHLHCATPWAHKVNECVRACIPEAAYLIENMSFELIGDGLHIAPQTIEMAAKFKKPLCVSLTTDAMRAAGQNVTESYLGEKLPENRVIIEGGVAKLPDRSSFAGSIATMAAVFKNACLNTRLPIEKISEMMSAAPAAAIGADREKGSIEKGKDADFVITEKSSHDILHVVSMGRIIR